MPDISKCYGTGCDKKDKCFRYTCQPDVCQSYFQPNPVDCEHFINNDPEQVSQPRKIMSREEVFKWIRENNPEGVRILEDTTKDEK